MQITKLVSDGVEETIQGLHLFPIGTSVVLDSGEYEVVDVEFLKGSSISTVVIYLTELSAKASYGLKAMTQAVAH